ncbi:hypothetical protein BC826DRAFT_58178 [Russula brevipes]|nr:hypothetical protein BC826DRAFT_58178 [Russula brevipes]
MSPTRRVLAGCWRGLAARAVWLGIITLFCATTLVTPSSVTVFKHSGAKPDEYSYCMITLIGFYHAPSLSATDHLLTSSSPTSISTLSPDD